jgi:hypothetical protein
MTLTLICGAMTRIHHAALLGQATRQFSMDVDQATARIDRVE